MIDNEFGNDILTLEDDDGVEHTFEVLDAIDNGENRYMALSLSMMTHSRLWRTAASWSSSRWSPLMARNFWKPSRTRTKWMKSPTSSWNAWKRITM